MVAAMLNGLACVEKTVPQTKLQFGTVPPALPCTNIENMCHKI